MVNMPGSRLAPVADSSVVSATTPLVSKPGSVLGLASADLSVQSTLTGHSVTLNSTAGPAAPLTATYFSGSNGQMVNPSEPVLPLETRNVPAPAPLGGPPASLRGVGFRGGSYTDNPTGGPVLPLTDAPATELRGLHSFFSSSVMYPVLPWRVNYFDALMGGQATRLNVTPAQYVSSGPASRTGTLRTYSAMNFRLYYGDPVLSTTTYGQNAGHQGNVPALAPAPAISRISARPSADGQSIAFRVNVEGDPSAGIQQVWITYTATAPGCNGGLNPCAGQWQSLDLVQDGDDSTMWKATLPLAGSAAGDVRYLVQAVNGVGVVGTATNMGAYYVPQPRVASTAAPKTSPSLSFSSAPAGGAYRDRASFTAVLTAGASPVSGRPVAFEFGPQRLQAVTDSNGNASVTFSLLQSPGSYVVRAAFEEAQDLLPSATESAFTIARQNTTLTLTGGSTHYSDSTAVVATLADQSSPAARRLREQTVMFIVTQGASSWVLPVITDELGRATLGQLPLSPGAYTVTAYFSGTIPIPTSSGVVPLTLNNDRYSASSATLTGGLTVAPEPATAAYTGDTMVPASSPIHVAARVNQESDDAPGDITTAQTLFTIKDSNGAVVSQSTTPVAADGTSSTSLAALPAGVYRIESSVSGNFTATAASVSLVVFDPAVSTTGSGAMPTTLLPPNNTVTLDFNLKYDPSATRPSGTLHVTRGLPAASPPAPAASTPPPAINPLTPAT